ncbi:type I polyketide synthase [Amycolatopsis vastitatis]|uniref:Polyketide synthase type I n=1 Tax=Amycolatopsis vastitatis TaxID=1905142 RepID=A0A229TE74_9PSEU|nr:type I polyketide synthase [Amycolatopsis vastitatis]OXM69555.1 polyketide synthase type I [Amycolatopsis vastitatis]
MSGQDIAVIGFACRFPGAGDVWRYWSNIEAGRVSITTLTREELLRNGVPQSEVDDPWYVPSRGRIDGAEHFDADFFGITPKDAALTDPQHRLLLQTAWEALETAGLTTNRPFGRVGVFAGSGFGHYLVHSVLKDPDVTGSHGLLAAVLGNEKDHLAAKIAYRLDLGGPALTVQTACSTSLVAVHLACQSLHTGDADVVLAGGVSVPFPQDTGYLYEPGGVLSPDGGCRPFDATAAGTVPGGGVGMVVLKRLDDALRDGDLVYAVVKGSAINNDGGAKAGYTAPGVRGQLDVLSRAYANAAVAPETVGYVEAHGTATEVGDAIELAALTEVFGGRDRPCSLGSVKANIGHLDAAAGVAGFIKAVLALHFERIPPMAGLTRPRAEIDGGTTFTLDSRARKWTDSRTRRAAVSAFGLGGTNAHVVLEEAPARPGLVPRTRQATAVLTVSARTAADLEAAKARLAAHLRASNDVSVHDVALTLQSHRRHFPYRHAVAAEDVPAAVARLADPPGGPAVKRPDPVFLFPGQGSEYAGMSAEPYACHRSFQSDVDSCAEAAVAILGFDLREVLLDPDAPAERVHRTDVAQPALLVHEYALGRLLVSWGVRPAILIGHSAGEYAAACLAGELDVDDALNLVALRGALMQAAPPGRMLAALTDEEVARRQVREIGGLDLAAVNGPDNVVLSGTGQSIEELRARFDHLGVRHRMLPARRAFHSRMMTGAADRLRSAPAAARGRARRIDIVSALDGSLLPRGARRDAGYWADQVVAPVRFLEALRTGLATASPLLVEVGPGKALTAAARAVPEARDAAKIAVQPDRASPVVAAAGALWTAGANLRWDDIRQSPAARVPLPTYPFARNEYRLRPVAPEPVPQPAPAEPGSGSEPVLAQVIEVWLDLLGTVGVRPGSDFFDLGGESLLFVRMVARLQRRFGVPLEVDALAATPTPAAIAAVITAAPERN